MRPKLIASALLCFCCSCWFESRAIGGFGFPPWTGHHDPSGSQDAGGAEVDAAASADAGLEDSGSSVDGGSSDAGSGDAGQTDAAAADGGFDDASDDDAGETDAASTDAQVYRVMAVGDSIVAGYTDPPTWNVPFNFGWRSGLYKLLQAAYPNQFTFVGTSPEPWESAFGNLVDAPFLSPDLRALDQDHHRGYGAVGTYEIAIQVLDWIEQDDPDIVLLMIGINDIPAGSVEEPVQAEINLQWMVNAIVDSRPEVEIVVAQLTPYSSITPGLIVFNQFIRDVLVPELRLRTDKVHTVDQYPAVLSGEEIDPALFANGYNHPSPEAYDRMAKIWFDGLVPIFERNRSAD